jgi:hypothetical protein
LSENKIKNLLGELILRELSKEKIELNANNKPNLEILLKDFMACAYSGKSKYCANESEFPAGLTQSAVRLGLYGSADDLDDVDWSVLTHTGTIIWATAISAGISLKVPIDKVLSAAAHGYRTGSTIAKLFGPIHRSRWHVTATSGAFSSVSTAAAIFGLTPQQHLAAFKFCAINMGGLPQAVFEREGAAQFNRSAAISLGISSVHAALMGASHVHDIWSPPRGLAENFLIAPEVLTESNEKSAQDFLIDGISTTGLRLFPCTGFAHAAVLAIYELRQQLPGDITSITVDLTQRIEPLMDGSRGGNWWNPRAAVASVAYSKDPMVISAPEHFIDKTQLVFSEIPVGGGRVTLESEGKVLTITHLKPPGLTYDLPQEIIWRNEKWRQLIGDDFEQVLDSTHSLDEIEKLLL